MESRRGVSCECRTGGERCGAGGWRSPGVLVMRDPERPHTEEDGLRFVRKWDLACVLSYNISSLKAKTRSLSQPS